MDGRSGGAAELGDVGGQRAEVLGLASAVPIPALPTSYVRAAAQSDLSLHKVVLIAHALCIFLLAKDARDYSVDGL